MLQVEKHASGVAEEIHLHLQMVKDLQAEVFRKCQHALEQEPFKDRWEISIECEPASAFAPRRSVAWDAALRVGIA